MTESIRHRWGDEVRLQFKTEAECARCQMVRAGHRQHEGGRDLHWTEFWRDGEKVSVDKTPPCDARLETATRGGSA